MELTRKIFCSCLKTGDGSLAGLRPPSSPKSRCWQASAAADGLSGAGWRGSTYGKTTVDMGIIARPLNHTSSSLKVYGNWFSMKTNERNVRKFVTFVTWRWSKRARINHSKWPRFDLVARTTKKKKSAPKARLYTTVWYLTLRLSHGVCIGRRMWDNFLVKHTVCRICTRLALGQHVRMIPTAGNTSCIHFARTDNTALFAMLIKLGSLIAWAGPLQSVNNGASSDRLRCW